MTQQIAKLENTSELGRKLFLTIPLTMLKEAYKQKLQKIASTAEFDGFRKGKVPEKLLIARIGLEIRREVINDVLHKELNKALRKNNITEHVGLKVNDFDFEKAESFANDLHIEVEFEVYPELTIKDFSTLKLTKYQVNITEKDIERELLMRQRNYGTNSIVERPAQIGDKVYVHCVLKYQGEVTPDILKEEQSVLLIDPSEYNTNSEKSVGYCEYIGAWQRNLLGAETNQTKTFDITFSPKSNHQLAGKTAALTITVQKIEAIELHPINSELARLLKVPDNNIDGINDVIRNYLESSITHSVTTLMRTTAADWLEREHNFPIPKFFASRLGKDVLTDKELKAIKLEMLVRKIFKTNKLQVSTQELVNKYIEERIFSYDEQSKQYIMFLCMQDKVSDLIIGSAIIEEEPCSLLELISMQNF